jgi:hypothetical protein
MAEKSATNYWEMWHSPSATNTRVERRRFTTNVMSYMSKNKIFRQHKGCEISSNKVRP